MPSRQQLNKQALPTTPIYLRDWKLSRSSLFSNKKMML